MIIGLSGVKGSGKSTLARILVEQFQFVELSFANPLKQGLISMLGLSEEQVQVTKEETDTFWGVTPRRLMQVIGTELMREQLPTILPEMKDVWIRCLEKQILEYPGRHIVVSDCRFLDEACFIRNQGGVLWRVYRTPSAYTSTVSDFHSSEQMGFEVDVHIDNSGTLEMLERHVRTNLGAFHLKDGDSMFT